MANIENILENIMNEPDGGDSSLSTLYENPNVLNIDPLEINDLNSNIIVLNDKFEFRGGSAESGDGALNTSNK